MFYKTNYDLSAHIRTHPNWSPKNETIRATLSGLRPDVFYEICLAAVEHGTIYYIHR
jgi:hypothetical protein